MGERNNDSEDSKDKFLCTKGKDEEESIEIEEACLSHDCHTMLLYFAFVTLMLLVAYEALGKLKQSHYEFYF